MRNEKAMKQAFDAILPVETLNQTQPTPQDDARRRGVAVIGTGTMGSAISRRLLQVGIPVGVWNRSPQAALALAEVGAIAFDDPKDAVAEASVVLTLLPTTDAVTDVMIGRDVVDALAPQAVWAQMGTIGVEATEALVSAVRARRPDVRFVDAPVSGSRHPAESGELLVLASGPEAALGTVGPVFDAIGRRTLWVGPAGTGSRLRLVLNTRLAFEVEAAAEAAALAARIGINSSVLAAAIDGNPLAVAVRPGRYGTYPGVGPVGVYGQQQPLGQHVGVDAAAAGHGADHLEAPGAKDRFFQHVDERHDAPLALDRLLDPDQVPGLRCRFERCKADRPGAPLGNEQPRQIGQGGVQRCQLVAHLLSDLVDEHAGVERFA
jgi:3-hydroxyisobutyrate dehydrogenase